jgi:hypothetical protein
MNIVRSSETSVNFYQTTPRHIPEYNTHRGLHRPCILCKIPIPLLCFISVRSDLRVCGDLALQRKHQILFIFIYSFGSVHEGFKYEIVTNSLNWLQSFISTSDLRLLYRDSTDRPLYEAFRLKHIAFKREKYLCTFPINKNLYYFTYILLNDH